MLSIVAGYMTLLSYTTIIRTPVNSTLHPNFVDQLSLTCWRQEVIWHGRPAILRGKGVNLTSGLDLAKFKLSHVIIHDFWKMLMA